MRSPCSCSCCLVRVPPSPPPRPAPIPPAPRWDLRSSRGLAWPGPAWQAGRRVTPTLRPRSECRMPKCRARPPFGCWYGPRTRAAAAAAAAHVRCRSRGAEAVMRTGHVGRRLLSSSTEGESPGRFIDFATALESGTRRKLRDVFYASSGEHGRVSCDLIGRRLGCREFKVDFSDQTTAGGSRNEWKLPKPCLVRKDERVMPADVEFAGR